jgi:hypothetical protein
MLLSTNERLIPSSDAKVCSFLYTLNNLYLKNTLNNLYLKIYP